MKGAFEVAFCALPIEVEGALRAQLARIAPKARIEVLPREEAAHARGLVFLWDDYDATEVLEAIFHANHRAQVIVLAQRLDAARAEHLMRLGALDVRIWPCPDEALQALLLQSMHLRALAAEAQQRQGSGNHGFVACDPVMRRLLDQVALVAPSRASILIVGETGVGKERLARFIHACSDRAQRPFVAINCAAIPEGVLEAELFGHEKGAFTGADRARPGRFELADGGTLLLDEITEMPIHLQPKLLRVLQEREVDRLGGRRPIPVDVRVIATSNRDLEQAIAEGRLREDLYFRLGVVVVELPPLRARPADIVPLAEAFLARFASEYGRPAPLLSEAAKERLLAHDWPGNARELENCMHRAFLMAAATGEVLPEHLSLQPHARRRSEGARLQPGMRIRDMERALIEETLRHVRGNREQAARLLGISVRTLRNKLKAYRESGAPLAIPEGG